MCLKNNSFYHVRGKSRRKVLQLKLVEVIDTTVSPIKLYTIKLKVWKRSSLIWEVIETLLQNYPYSVEPYFDSTIHVMSKKIKTEHFNVLKMENLHSS